MRRHYFINRTLCEVLEEMRGLTKTSNYSYLPGLIEEAQSMANKMESALSDKKDIIALQEDCSKLRGELKELELKKKFLTGDEDDKSVVVE